MVPGELISPINKTHRVKRFIGLRYIYHMMRNTRKLTSGGFSCPNIKSPIYLHGISSNDFTVESFGEIYPNPSLAGSSGTRNYYYWDPMLK